MPARAFRISFTGELSYGTVTAEYGLSLWKRARSTRSHLWPTRITLGYT